MPADQNVPPVQSAAPILVPTGAQGKHSKEKDEVTPADSPRQLILGLLFGILFGFLLQKGGVAKYEVLMGQFLLTDFTVIKVMLTAIVVGMVGIFSMHAMGLVKLHVKPAAYAANIIGGLLFGVGLALLGYCPGTGAAAFGQGNYDAIAGIAGLLAGSYLYAETSGFLSSTIEKIGNRGQIMLPDKLGVRLWPFLAYFVPLLGFALWMLHWFAPGH